MRPLQVIVVDDNDLNARLAEFVLKTAAIDVVTVLDPREAERRIAADRPDLVLMDIEMPGIDGLSITRRLKADPRTRGIVVVAFTAYAMKGDEARMLAAGCDGYISKPIDVARFAAEVVGFARRRDAAAAD